MNDDNEIIDTTIRLFFLRNMFQNSKLVYKIFFHKLYWFLNNCNTRFFNLLTELTVTTDEILQTT